MRGAKGENYSDVTNPLRELTRQGVWFKWTEEFDKRFKRLKEMLVSDTVMVSYNTKLSTRLYVDHGPNGVCATIAQRYDVPGEKKPEWRPVSHPWQPHVDRSRGGVWQV